MVRHSTLRMHFSLAVELDMTIDHMDVITAFLNGNLKEKYIWNSHNIMSMMGIKSVLRMAIYGLKQMS
jgi:hypothetical protein